MAKSLRSLLLAALLAAAAPAPAADAVTTACRLKGIDREVLCGRIAMPENPDAPGGRQIEIHFAVVPALARSRAFEPVFVFAGGPGQSARGTAGQMQPLFVRLNARRDIVYVDQRGTGASNALACPRERPDAVRSLAEALDAKRVTAQTVDCLRRLAADNDLRQYATWIAVRDIDAVRAALGHERINIWGASYGTRAALEYLRQFGGRVRSMVLDGVAPPDMALPASFAIDAQASLDALIEVCALDPRCNERYPALRARLDRLLERAGAGFETSVQHPLTGQHETLRIERDTLAAALRVPLYAPPLAALLPHALAEASRDNLAPLLAISTSLSSQVAENLAEGMHFAVVCAEDLPRVDGLARAAAEATRLGRSFVAVYDEACAAVPRREVPAQFYGVSDADVPVLILSGGMDPATPPRHGERIARLLKRATHAIAPNLGHGVSMHGCAPDLIASFIRNAAVAGIDAGCLRKLPSPTFFASPATRRAAP